MKKITMTTDGAEPDFSILLEGNPSAPSKPTRSTAVEKEERAMNDLCRAEDAHGRGIPAGLHSILGITRGIRLPIQSTAAVQAVGSHRGGFLLLLGPPGTGKTFASALWAWKRKGFLMKATVLASLDHFSKDGQHDLDLALAQHPLVIDDLGSERPDPHGYWAARLDEIIDIRFDYGTTTGTIITSNLSASALNRRVGERVWDRMAGGTVISCDGPSLRGPR